MDLQSAPLAVPLSASPHFDRVRTASLVQPLRSLPRRRRHPRTIGGRSPARLRAYPRGPQTCPRDDGRTYSRGYAAGRVALTPSGRYQSSVTLTQGRLAIPARSGASHAPPHTLSLSRSP